MIGPGSTELRRANFGLLHRNGYNTEARLCYMSCDTAAPANRVHWKHGNIQPTAIGFEVTKSNEVISPQKKMVHCRYGITRQKD